MFFGPSFLLCVIWECFPVTFYVLYYFFLLPLRDLTWFSLFCGFPFSLSCHYIALGFSQLGIWLPCKTALKFDIRVKLLCCEYFMSH